MGGSAFVVCEVAVLKRHPGYLGRLISTLKKTNSDLLTYFKMLNSVKAHTSAQNQPPSSSLCMINGALLLMACIWEFSDLAENVTALGGEGSGMKDYRQFISLVGGNLRQKK